MTQKIPDTRDDSRSNLLLLTIGSTLFVLYYIADCALDSLVFGEGTFAGHLFAPSAHEVAIRILSGAFLFALYVVSTLLINKNRALQCELLNKTEEILTRNREIDTYNQTLSWEIHATLTRVMLTNQRLQFDCYQCSTRRCRERLTELTGNCDQLSEQFGSMLNYSDAIRSELKRTRVAIGNLAREIAMDLSEKTKNETLTFEIDNNLETECDPELMRIALRKLIGSSLDNSSRHKNESIRFGMKKRKGVPIYFIGGSLADQDEDLLPGDPTEPLSGTHTPINIRTAREIIERHGGHLWTRGNLNAPPTYYFTL